MTNDLGGDGERIARQWCEAKGGGWSVCDRLGEGGTAPVFEIASPDGLRALKVYDAKFSAGEKGEIEAKRIEQQLSLQGHNCSSLVQIYEGGEFEDRLFLLMGRAPGEELEKRLNDVPRNKIRRIVGQVCTAALFLKSKDLCHRDIKAANIFISDDFSQATLLDISVIRNVYDPIGVGTDHAGQLPVVATARYSPPEYLFRLLNPSPELWHALTVYQLGALLHDLIMKEPLFQSEYLKSAENRYRFAWIVATDIPRVQADDVDQDLVFTACRALDKNWERRSTLRLEDFLADSNIQQVHALQLLGLTNEPDILERSEDVGLRLKRVREVARSLEDEISDRLRRKGATTQHILSHGDDDYSKLLSFRWNAPLVAVNATSESIELQLTLSLRPRLGRNWFNASAKLQGMIDGEAREAVLHLPDVEDSLEAESLLANQVDSALPVLAVEFSRPQTGKQEG
jgi:serine/threonine protein kinase